MSDDPPTPHLPTDDPDLAELRGRMRGQWKAERRAHEHEARREHWQNRDLVDAVRDAMHHGDHIAVHLPGSRTIAGHLVATGGDYALVRAPHPPHREYGIRLAGAATGPYTGPQLSIEVIPGDPSAPAPERRDVPPTFQALLQQYDFHQQANPRRQVEIGTTLHPRGLRCTLQAHAGDHLCIHDADGRTHLIPTATLIYIAWAAPL